MMQVVIELDEKLYTTIKSLPDFMCGTLQTAIKNGVPLPKNHGALKDMDDIYEALEGWNDDTGWIVDAIDFQAPTIIEADGGDAK